MTGGQPTLELWFEPASTYSYLAVSRIGPAAQAAGVAVAWRPFLLGPIFRAQGWDTSPFNLQPAKGRYMWRDMQRQCTALGLPLVRPSQFPRNSVLAARAALVAEEEGWCAAFAAAVLRANFAEDRDIADPQVIAAIAGALGRDGAGLLDRAQSPAIKDGLRRQTDRAAALGIFGAPTLVTADGELFWGDDRLDQAIAWATQAP
ncbi:MAG: 2-hydroxychromene-2-carboxylate isomerase [Rhodospirillaceae bacterium]|nr:2-hydroxychromene-2-carboxylate isomerase [Rhodospirillaceae bacterium]